MTPEQYFYTKHEPTYSKDRIIFSLNDMIEFAEEYSNYLVRHNYLIEMMKADEDIGLYDSLEHKTLKEK